MEHDVYGARGIYTAQGIQLNSVDELAVNCQMEILAERTNYIGIKVQNEDLVNAGNNLLTTLTFPLTSSIDQLIVQRDFVFPDKAEGTYTLATTDDGGGSQTLAETLVLGNITDGTDIGVSNGDAVVLDNGSKLMKGTIDAGYGGSKGIAQICAVGYELKWEAGRLYVMGDGGTTIREVSHNFTTTPTATDDIGKGFIVGSRWILDNGDLYICTDNTDDTAVWELQPNISDVNTDAVDKVTVKLALGISKGQAVYISSATGTNIIVSKASNSSEATSSKTLGLLATTGVTNDIVTVVTSGLLDGLDTSTATVGDPVWLGTSGNLIYGLASKPVAPAHLVYIGVVSRVSATVGEIFVRVQNGFELNEIHDVLITSVADNQVLNYDSASSLWKNKTLAKSDVGLGNVDNTSDANKPISTATQTALDLKEVLSDVGRLSSDYTLSNVATAQKIFNIGSSGNGSFNALASTLYEIELFVNLTSLSSTSGFFSFSLAGTATYTDLQLDLFATKAALISGSVFQGVITSASAFQCTTSNANTVGTIKIKGLINVNGAGTIIPTITLSQASAGVVKKNSYFVFRKLGASSFTASANII
jgi:hypothetical protein